MPQNPRAELTALERSKLVAEWAELTGESVASCDGKGGRGKREGVREAARQLGVDKDDVHRSIKVASLSPEAQAVAVEEGLDNNRSALLDAAARLRPLPVVRRSPVETW